jgi:hypothetical protein
MSRRHARAAALAVITVLIVASAAASFAESYRGLLDWALRHGLPFGWAIIAPLMVDVFICVGELSLFVLVLDAYPARARIPAWLIACCGLALSVAGNVGHLPAAWRAPAADMVTAGVPPVAAAAALAVGLGVLKRLLAGPPGADEPVAQPEPAPQPEPAARRTAPPAPPAPPRQRATDPAEEDWRAAVAAARATLAAGGKPSARQLALAHFDGSRRWGGRAVAAASNGQGP